MKGRRVEVPVHLPAMLRAVAGTKTLRVKAATLAEAVEEAFEAIPALRFHLCDDDGTFRTHVLCFLNDRNTRDLGTLDLPLRAGDEVTFIQAISGGAAGPDARVRSSP